MVQNGKCCKSTRSLYMLGSTVSPHALASSSQAGVNSSFLLYIAREIFSSIFGSVISPRTSVISLFALFIFSRVPRGRDFRDFWLAFRARLRPFWIFTPRTASPKRFRYTRLVSFAGSSTARIFALWRDFLFESR